MNALVRRVTAKFDPELFAELQETAREQRLSMSDVIRQSVLAHVAEQRPARRAPAERDPQ